MAQAYPYFVLTNDEYTMLLGMLTGEWGGTFSDGLLEDFKKAPDGKWYGNWTNMTQEERDFMDESEYVFDVISYTDSQMKVIMGP